MKIITVLQSGDQFALDSPYTEESLRFLNKQPTWSVQFFQFPQVYSFHNRKNYKLKSIEFKLQQS